MTVIMTMFGCHIGKQSTLSSICNFSAKRQWTLVIHSFCSSPMSQHLCTPDCIIFLIYTARADLEIQHWSIHCSTRLAVSLKRWKPIVLVLSKRVQCAFFSILYVSILVLITVLGSQKRSCSPVVPPGVESVNSGLLSGDFSAGYILTPWSRMEAWW